METMMEAMKMIDLTPLLEVLIALLASVITLKVLPLIKSKLTAQQQEMLKGTIRTLVYAAEQVYGSGYGEDKMHYVAERLRERGFELDIPAVEAAVREMTLFGGAEIEIEDEVEIEALPEMNLLAWTPEQLKEFCGVNGIECDGCETTEEYFYAIVAKGRERMEEPIDVE